MVPYELMRFLNYPGRKLKHLVAYALKAKSSLIQRMNIWKKLSLLFILIRKRVIYINTPPPTTKYVGATSQHFVIA